MSYVLYDYVENSIWHAIDEPPVRQIERISILTYVSPTYARTYLGLLSFNFIFVLHLYWYLRNYVRRSILEKVI